MPVVVRRKPIQVQLAKVYEGEPLLTPMWAEPKLDGLRGIIDVNTAVALTRTGMGIPNASHIVDELKDSGKFRNKVLDGEFLAENWNDSQSIVKTQNPHPDAKTLKFHVFDMLSDVEWSGSKCATRLIDRKFDLLARVGTNLPHVVYVEHEIISTAEEATIAMRQAVAKGYEGIMLKDPEAYYLFKKTSVWLKYKPFFEGDFEIVGAIEGRGKHAGKLGALAVEGKCDWGGLEMFVRSEVGTGFDDEQRAALWKRFEGGIEPGIIIEVQYQSITPDGKFRFPSFRRLREDK